jgi:hypothetical protein
MASFAIIFVVLANLGRLANNCHVRVLTIIRTKIYITLTITLESLVVRLGQK